MAPAPVAQLLHAYVVGAYGGQEERFLRVEVAVESARARGQADGALELGDGGAGVALLGEDAEGGLDQPVPCAGAPPICGRLRHRSPPVPARTAKSESTRHWGKVQTSSALSTSHFPSPRHTNARGIKCDGEAV